MKSFYLKIFLILFLFIKMSILGLTQTENTITDIPIVKKSEIKNFSVQPGIHDNSFELTNNEKWNVRISIPQIKPDKKYTLVLALHWAGNNDTYKEYSDGLAFPALDTLGAIIVVPSSEGMHWINPINEKRVIDLVKKIKKHWPIAEDQILITGYSNGGIGSWVYAANYPELFCASIPMAGYYEKKKMSIPIYAIHGEKDELFNVTEVTNAIEKSKELGSQIDLTVLENFSHYMARDYKKALHEKALLVKELIFKDQDESDNKD